MSLTSELDDPTSPITRWMASRLPWTRGVLDEYRVNAPPLAVQPGKANPGTIGGAFDWAIRFAVGPSPDLRMPMLVATHLGEGFESAVAELGELLGGCVSRRGTASATEVAPGDGGRELLPRDEEAVLRGCWAFALLTEVYRRGGLIAGSPLDDLPDRPAVADLLGLATDAAVADLRALMGLAATELLPALRSWGDSVHGGPTFAGSEHVSADADVVAGGVLLELKTTVGSKRRDGSRYCCLDTLTLRQIIGYALFDFDDRYAIRSVALYSGRYGYLATWLLDELLPELAGSAVNLADLRLEFEPVVRQCARSR